MQSGWFLGLQSTAVHKVIWTSNNQRLTKGLLFSSLCTFEKLWKINSWQMPKVIVRLSKMINVSFLEGIASKVSSKLEGLMMIKEHDTQEELAANWNLVRWSKILPCSVYTYMEFLCHFFACCTLLATMDLFDFLHGMMMTNLMSNLWPFVLCSCNLCRKCLHFCFHMWTPTLRCWVCKTICQKTTVPLELLENCSLN